MIRSPPSFPFFPYAPLFHFPSLRTRRLAGVCSGSGLAPRRSAQAVAQMATAADGAGRKVERWVNALNVWCGVGRTTQDARRHVAVGMEAFYQVPYERFERWSPAGTPQQVAEFLIPYVEAGCSVFNLIAQADDVETEIEATSEIRRLVLDATS